jgi:hypothetical protein
MGASAKSPASFIIQLRDQADLKHALASNAASLSPQDEGRVILDALRDVASVSQSSVLAVLDDTPGVSRIQPFFIANAIVVDVTSGAALARLMSHPDIAAIEPNRPFPVALETPGNDFVAADLLVQSNNINLGVLVNDATVWFLQ